MSCGCGQPKSRPVHGRVGNLDVITLNGYSRAQGVWDEVLGTSGLGGLGGCRAWKPVGKGCKCRPKCVSKTRKGMTKKQAARKCASKCSTKRR